MSSSVAQFSAPAGCLPAIVALLALAAAGSCAGQPPSWPITRPVGMLMYQDARHATLAVFGARGPDLMGAVAYLRVLFEAGEESVRIEEINQALLHMGIWQGTLASGTRVLKVGVLGIEGKAALGDARFDLLAGNRFVLKADGTVEQLPGVVEEAALTSDAIDALFVEGARGR